jgi:hypothetical protein
MRATVVKCRNPISIGVDTHHAKPSPNCSRRKRETDVTEADHCYDRVAHVVDNAPMSRRGCTRPNFGIVAAVIAILISGSLVGGGVEPASSATLASVDSSTKNITAGVCERLSHKTAKFTGNPTGAMTWLDWGSQRVPLTASGLRAFRANSAQESLWFHSLEWLIPIAARQPETAASIVSLFARTFPDPGPTATKIRSQSSGWTEGQIRRRLKTMICLNRAAPASIFVTTADILGTALLDDRRYYGLPLYMPHNHGAQSNLVLLKAATTFGRPEWAVKARQRILRDYNEVFSDCGISREQSSAYHLYNTRLWEKLAKEADLPRHLKVAQAGSALVRPDGVLEEIGDGNKDNQQANGGGLWCPQEGWAADTKSGMHYTLRFGPPRAMHGHVDKGSITWFTRGTPVLSDRGTADKKNATELTWSRSVAAHSVLEALGRSNDDPMTGRRRGASAYELISNGDIRQTRTVVFGVDRMRIQDVATSDDANQQWMQHWQFSPEWSPLRDAGSGRVSRMTGPGGAIVEVVCTADGREIDAKAVAVMSYQGKNRPPQRAWDVQCSDSGSTTRMVANLTWRGAVETADTAR